MKSKNIKSAIISAALLLGATTLCPAAILAHYGFNTAGNTDPDSVPAGITATTANTLGLGGDSGLMPIEGTRSRLVANTQLANSATPTTANFVATFSLTPEAGQTITLDATNSVVWKFLSYDFGVGTMPTFTKMFIASDSGFTNILAESAIFNQDHDGSAGGDARWGPPVTGILNSAVSSPATLYFGLAGTDNSSSGDKQLRFDDITVNGTIASVPESSSALLGGLGLLSLLRRRR